MSNANKEDKTKPTASCSGHVEPVVMWGDYEVTTYEGPRDLSSWDFGDETPWISLQSESLQFVSPSWDVINGEMALAQVGVSFLKMIQGYNETFLSTELCDIDEVNRNRKAAISELRKAIAILKPS